MEMHSASRGQLDLKDINVYVAQCLFAFHHGEIIASPPIKYDIYHAEKLKNSPDRDISWTRPDNFVYSLLKSVSSWT